VGNDVLHGPPFGGARGVPFVVVQFSAESQNLCTLTPGSIDAVHRTIMRARQEFARAKAVNGLGEYR